MEIEIRIGSSVFSPIAGRYYKFQKNGIWQLLFYHDSILGGFWKNPSETKYNLNASKYSILCELNVSYKTKGKFEFIIEYPNYSYVQWRQTNNPLDETTVDGTGALVEGLEILKSIRNSKFSGLAKSINSKSLLDGRSDIGSWGYAIGSWSNVYAPNFPGPSAFVSQAAMWVRLPIAVQLSCQSQIIGRHKIFVLIITMFCIRT